MVITHNITKALLHLCFRLIYVKKMTTAKPYLCTLVDYCFYFRNLEYISRILIFADLYLPRNNAKIGRRENFPFYGIPFWDLAVLISNV